MGAIRRRRFMPDTLEVPVDDAPRRKRKSPNFEVELMPLCFGFVATCGPPESEEVVHVELVSFTNVGEGS